MIRAAAVTCRIALMSLVPAAVTVMSAAPVAAVDPQSVARTLEPSVIRVLTTGPQGVVSGTGFLVSRSGHVATNYHVVAPHIEAEWAIFVTGSGVSGEDRLPASLIEAFPGEDLAVLQVEGLRGPPVRLSEVDAGRPEKGTPVFAIGFPGVGDRLGAGLETSFTTGIVSRVFTGSWSEEGPRIAIIQHSAPINPGSSGGPIVNACGQVLGVNSQREMAILVGPGGRPIVTDLIQGVFFASHVSVLVEKLKEAGIAYSGSRKSCRMFLGVASTNFDLAAGVAGFIAVALVIVLIAFKPQPVVQVCVRCGCAARDCARAVARAIRKEQ